METPSWAWMVFAVVVVLLLGIDLATSRAGASTSRKVTLGWSLAWIGVALGFGAFVWVILGSQSALEYFGAYAMEKGLSIDNIFLFYVIFQSLDVPLKFQHKVLFWGILGALIFRGLFLTAGVAALNRWEWITYLFGAALLYAAWDAFARNPARPHKSRMISLLSRHLPIRKDAEDGKFITRVNGRLMATPLLAALVTIELTDVLFALDSMPAALSITRNPFLVYSSNVFAILGLRALYLFLATSIRDLPYLHYGLAGVLAFASFKMLSEKWVRVPPLLSISIIVTMITAGIWASLRLPPESETRAGS